MITALATYLLGGLIAQAMALAIMAAVWGASSTRERLTATRERLTGPKRHAIKLNGGKRASRMAHGRRLY